MTLAAPKSFVLELLVRNAQVSPPLETWPLHGWVLVAGTIWRATLASPPQHRLTSSTSPARQTKMAGCMRIHYWTSNKKHFKKGLRDVHAWQPCWHMGTLLKLGIADPLKEPQKCPNVVHGLTYKRDFTFSIHPAMSLTRACFPSNFSTAIVWLSVMVWVLLFITLILVSSSLSVEWLMCVGKNGRLTGGHSC